MVGDGTVMFVDALSLLVRDGDLAEATGRVVAVPGQPLRFCARPATVLEGPAGAGPAVIGDKCPGVDLVGVDLTRLCERNIAWAHLRGIYRDGVLTVTEYPEPRRDEPPNARHGRTRLPCPAPPGGWHPIDEHLRRLSADRRNGFLAFGGGVLDLVVLDQYVYEQLRPIEIEKLCVAPWMYPSHLRGPAGA